MSSFEQATITFDTAIGRCAVRWSEAGITGLLLPHPAGRPGRAFDDAVDAPAFVRSTIHEVVALLARGSGDLRRIPLDVRGIDAFRCAVYAETREIPAGSTRSYGEIARAIGQPDAAREVGTALARNPFAIIVPCHRVVAANGALTGFSAPGGLEVKRRLLEREGAPGYGQRTLFD